MANGVLGMTPKLGKRKAEVMTAVLHFWEPHLTLWETKARDAVPTPLHLFAKHKLAHLSSPRLPLLLLQEKEHSSLHHGRYSKQDKAEKSEPGRSP